MGNGSWGTAEWDALGSLISAGASIIAGVAAVIAVVLAGRQLRELTRSNNELSESNLSLVRPYLLVDFEFKRSSGLTPGGGSTHVFVAIRSIGKTPVRQLTLSVDPPFQSTMSVANGTVSEDLLPKLNEAFDGTKVIRMLTAERPIRMLLDDPGDAMGNETLPKVYTVSARYSDTSGKHSFEETFELEMDPWALSISEEDKLNRISKDLQKIDRTISDAAKR